MNLLINTSSPSLVAIGTMVGGRTFNPIVLGTISGSGLLLKPFSEIKNYNKKIEMSKFTYTTYQKVLVELRSCLRGNDVNHTNFINDMRLLDEMITDFSHSLINLKNSIIENVAGFHHIPHLEIQSAWQVRRATPSLKFSTPL